MAITISGNTLAEVLALAAELGGAAAPAAEGKASTGRGSSKAKDKETPPEDTGPTVEEIRELAGKIETDEDQDKAITVISDAGAESISGLEKKSAKVRQTVYDAIKEIVEKAAAKGKRKALD